MKFLWFILNLMPPFFALLLLVLLIYLSGMPTPQDVLHFWFEELTPKHWFQVSEELDQSIKNRFQELHEMARKGELFHWRTSPDGRLAEIILLDQFSRNIYRGSSMAFGQDTMALVLAQEMVLLGLDTSIPVIRRAFVYLPYMHSESRAIHLEALRLFATPGLEDNLKFEKLHKDIIDRFGRYPHRNAILGRTSTEEEREFLKSHPGF